MMFRRYCCFALLVATAFTLQVQSLQAATFEDLLRLRENGAFVAAIKQADALLTDTPDDTDILLIRGQLLSFIGHFDEAERDLAQSLKLAPDYADAGFALARVHSYQQRHQDALRRVRQTLQQHPNRIDGWLLLARFSAITGDNKERLQALTQAQSIDRNNPELLVLMGDYAADTHQTISARSFYERRLDKHGFNQRVAAKLAALTPADPAWTYTSLASASDHNDDRREGWREWFNQISYRESDDRSYRLHLEYSERFGENDLYIASAIDQRINERSVLTGFIATTPDADFRPHLQASADVTVQVFENTKHDLATTVSAGLEMARYNRGTARSLRLGATQYFPKFWLTARVVNTLDEQNNHDVNASIRTDLILWNGIRIFTGSGLEFDTEDRNSRTTTSYFGGLNLRLNDRVDWFIDFLMEDPDIGARRRAVTSGFSVVFSGR